MENMKYEGSAAKYRVVGYKEIIRSSSFEPCI